MADMVSKGRQSKGEKSSNAGKKAHAELKARDPELHFQKFTAHMVGEKNCNAKLSEEAVRAIFAFAGSAKEIAARFGVSVGVVSGIRRGKSWRQVTSNAIKPERYEYQSPGLPGSKNPSAKLSEEDVRQIRKSTDTQEKIAAKFGIGQTHVSRILRREIWKHLK